MYMISSVILLTADSDSYKYATYFLKCLNHKLIREKPTKIIIILCMACLLCHNTAKRMILNYNAQNYLTRNKYFCSSFLAHLAIGHVSFCHG